MPYENANFISQLDPTSPDGDVDDVSQGDDELRQLKRSLLNQFPNLGAAAVTATAGEINNVVSTGGALSVGSSTTPLTIATGTQSFVIQANRGFAVGQTVKVTYEADSSISMVGTVTSYNIATGAMVVDVLRKEGSGSFAQWAVVVFFSPGLPIIREVRTSNAQITASDHGKLIEASGTFTQTLDAPATLGDGWWVYYRNGGTGVVTLGPTIVVPGETLLLVCNGSDVLHQVVELPKPRGYKVLITSSADWVAPFAGYYIATVQGAGGSGAAVSSSVVCAATGGAAGGRARKLFKCAAGTSVAAVIGAGGTAAFSTGANGVAGGATTFIGGPVSITANGGAGGTFRNTVGSLTGAVGGTATGGDGNWQGGASGNVSNSSSGGTACAASGGGASAVNGTGYASGAVTIDSGAQLCAAASGGAGVAGGSGAASITSGVGGKAATGGGGALAASASVSVTTATTASGGGDGMAALVAQHNSSGSNGSIAGAPASASGNGGGGGGACASAGDHAGGAGAMDAGGGGAAVGVSTGGARAGGAGGLGGGGGGIADRAGSMTVRGGYGGNGYVIVEG